jgi:hypothetical protein
VIAHICVKRASIGREQFSKYFAVTSTVERGANRRRRVQQHSAKCRAHCPSRLHPRGGEGRRALPHLECSEYTSALKH